MPTRKYDHGTFFWVELATTDASAAKKFYGELFGWTFEDDTRSSMPGGPDMIYTTAKLGEDPACALYELNNVIPGVPPNWLSFITVKDVDATAKKIIGNGGKLLTEAFDVKDIGRMLVATDPTGAPFGLWQAKTPEHGTGAISWNELHTNNVDQAGKFYVNVLGWTTKAVDMGPMGTYVLFNRPSDEKNDAGGMMQIAPNMKGVPPHWLAYFAAADVDTKQKKVESLGGKTIVPPTDIPNMGRFSIVQDPQGAVFGLFQRKH